MIKGPLTGIRVIDFGSAHAGNYGAKHLGDLGAELLKIESPGQGDIVRHLAPMAGDPKYLMGCYVTAMCRNTKSVCLDMYTDSGKEAFYDLVKVSDIVYDNYRAGVMKRVGADWDTIRKINPRIISCSVVGYGSAGPYADRGAVDDIAEGLSGMSSLCGEKGGGIPARSPVAIADISAGMFSTIGIITALYEREHTGKGRRVEVNLLDTCMSLMDTHYAGMDASGNVPGPQGSVHPMTPMLGAFKAKDGWMIVGPAWPRIFRVIHREEVIDDPRFQTPTGRYENRGALEELLTEGLEQENVETWKALFEAEDILAGPLNTMDWALRDPQVIYNKTAITLEHPKYGKIQNMACPIKIEGAIEGEYTPPPLLGEHTEEVLKGILGYSDDKIKKMSEEAEKHSAELRAHVRRLV